MTRTVMNKEDNEYKVYYLKELKRFGMTDEELNNYLNKFIKDYETEHWF